MTLPIPNPTGEESTQKVHSSWVNNLSANTYVAPYGLLFFDTYDGVLRLGDNVTPGGQIINTGGSGNGVPALPYNSIQFNNANVFGGSANLTYDATLGVLALTGTANVVGDVNVTGNVAANTVFDNFGIFLNATTITSDFTVPTGYNGISGGPMTIGTNVVTIPNGQRWTIV